MIRILPDQTFLLETEHTVYAMRVRKNNLLEHVYYGKKTSRIPHRLIRKRTAGNTVSYDPSCPEESLEMMSLEMSSYGKGDIREPLIELTAPDGSFTSDFVYESYMILGGSPAGVVLPVSYGTEEEAETLVVTMRDKNHGYGLKLLYRVYEACDVITRQTIFLNDTYEPVTLNRLLSLQLELPGHGYRMTTFTGQWAREMCETGTRVSAGRLEISSVAGSSGNRANPFFMVSRRATEEKGDVYAFNLVYSGNHTGSVSVGGGGHTRVLTGINPTMFSYRCEPGEMFEAPEAVMTYSETGFGGISDHMHRFVRRHIVRGTYRDLERPILLNSWEANYFDIDEERLLEQARRGAEAGIELFVMDDGWFGHRDDDRSSLGDWTVNEEKIPGGLRKLSERIRSLGMGFGLWVEPEMVNTDSELYRAHPDWTLSIPGMAHAEGRFQRILDLTNPAVVEYMTGVMTDLFNSAEISYVKWDYNRIFSDYYAPYLPPERQGEVGYRYMTGLYRMMRTLTERFPDILFEGCAAGGGRFDLGILCFCPQIWGSDNTDAVCRLTIQNGYSYGYPQVCCTSHVSAVPNHQTGRSVPLSTRFAVAAFFNLGYELDLSAVSSEEFEQIREQIAWYKAHRKELQQGRFRRIRRGKTRLWEITDGDRRFVCEGESDEDRTIAVYP